MRRVADPRWRAADRADGARRPPLAVIASIAATLTGTHHRFGRLATIPAATFAAMLLLRFFEVGGRDGLNLAWFKFDWSLIVLISLLPLLGCLHFAYLSRTMRAPVIWPSHN